MNRSFLTEKFAAALPYDRYVLSGSDEQRRRWQQVYEAAQLTDTQKQLVAGFVRDMKVLIVSGIWCGDCVQQCPLLQRIAESNPPRIVLRLLDRDQHRDLAEKVRINAGDRVPVALFLAEDHELCSVIGDRPLSRYRALAARQLGPSCPTGIVPPGADELAATLQDWLNEFERVQLMLRLSARLRQKHND
ncbi:MAG TPA: thioredoxin family protein [Gemmataceae bacterium]|nr:thioredoxin family protein [Gemmataceae bacterium]